MDYYYVTRSSRGLGRALAERLLAEPEVFVIGLARNQSFSHERYEHVELDLSDFEATSRFAFSPHGNARRIALVNNAGILQPRYLGRLEPAEILASYMVNA